MTWDWLTQHWTTYTAVWGAVTGTYGAYVSTRGRRDIKWKRAAKPLSIVRPALQALRAGVAEASRNTRTIGSLYQDYTLRGHREEIQDQLPSLSDGPLKERLTRVDSAYAAILALGEDPADHQVTRALAEAEQAIADAMDRIELITRKAPA